MFCALVDKDGGASDLFSSLFYTLSSSDALTYRFFFTACVVLLPLTSELSPCSLI
jgi:hypothetical protein